jgi:hypothetical protein
MKQLCEMVKEYMMEGERERKQAIQDVRHIRLTHSLT